MALKEKHAWRRRLGLRGSLWCFEEPKKPKPPSVFSQPAAWSALVAAISAVLTAIFAYNNYLFTKQSYSQLHPPKLVAFMAQIEHGEGGWTYKVSVRNEGDTAALHVDASLGLSDFPEDDPGVVFGNDVEIEAGGTDTLRAGPIDRGPKRDGDFVSVVLRYNDGISSGKWDYFFRQRKDIFCGTVKESVAVLGACDSVIREYQEKPAPKSAR